jgi:hypothetical protein
MKTRHFADSIIAIGLALLFCLPLVAQSAPEHFRILALRNGGGAPPASLAYYEEVIADAPEIYYRMNEASGSSFYDSSGNWRTATLYNSPTLGVAGATPRNTAATFSTTGNTYASTTALSLLSNWTIEAWVKRDGSQAYYTSIVADGFLSASINYMLFWDGTSIVAGYYAGGFQLSASSSAISDGVWTHVAGTYDGANLKVYINGVLDVTTASATACTADNYLIITGAKWDTGDAFKGDLDEVAIYSTALSATRIAAHYDARNVDNGFVLSDITGLAVHLEEASITGLGAGDPVTSWLDSGYLGNDPDSIAGATYRTSPTRLEWAASAGAIYATRPVTSTTATMFFVLDTTDNLNGMVSGSGSHYVGLGQSGSTSSSYSTAGTPSYRVDGVALGGTTRGDIYTNVMDGAPHVLTVENVNVTAWPALHLWTNQLGGSWRYVGDAYACAIYGGSLSSAEREAVEDYLGAEYGITITH